MLEAIKWWFVPLFNLKAERELIIVSLGISSEINFLFKEKKEKTN